MNVIRKVTWATLRKNKRRTIITILGTAVAVAMVTALAVLTSSLLDMSRREAIATDGEWHLSFRGVDPLALPLLQQQPEIETVYLSHAQGFARLPGREEYTRSELSLLAYTSDAYPYLPIQLTEGRLPQKPGEILLSNEFKHAPELGWKLNETQTLEFGHFLTEHMDENGQMAPFEIRSATDDIKSTLWIAEENRSFTVVGYGDFSHLEPGWQDSFTALTIFSPEAFPTGTFELSAWVLMKKADSNVYTFGGGMLEQLSELYSGRNLTAPSYNTPLLGLSGILASSSVFGAISTFIAILLLIIVVGSVSLINNAFSISLAERVRDLGMLAGVGATKKQKRASVFFEAALIALFAIPPGIAGGIAGIAITLALLGDAVGEILRSNLPMLLSVPVWAIVFTTVFSVFIVFFSAFLPARKASKIAPIEAMRSGGHGRIHKTRVSRLTRRLFGYEAELGIKNSKRSRRRYYAILSSLVISVVLFLTVSAAMQFIRQSAGLISADSPSAKYNVEITLTPTYETTEMPDTAAWFSDVRALPDAGKVDIWQSCGAGTDLPLQALNPQFLAEIQAELYGSSSVFFSVTIYALEDETFLRYCDQAGIDPAVLDNSSAIPAILLSPINTRTENGGWSQLAPTHLSIDDSFEISGDYSGEYIEEDVTIAAVSSHFPDFVSSQFSYGTMLPLVTRLSCMDSVAQQMWNGRADTWYQNYRMMAQSPNAAALYDQVESLEQQDYYAYVYNLEAERQHTQMTMLVMAVFTYGFVVLISLVCAANIFNTVSTGIALRAREFAMLRSVGLTPKGFNRMLDCETLFYGLKALLWGVPLSVGFSYWLYRALTGGFEFPFSLPFGAYLVAVAAVFLLVGSSMLYARRKVKKLNIAETIKNENW